MPTRDDQALAIGEAIRSAALLVRGKIGLDDVVGNF